MGTKCKTGQSVFVSRILIVLLSIMIAASPSGVFTQKAYAAPGDGTAPTAPTGLKVELLENAYAVDTKEPAFSWAVNDVDADEVQTAYRIVVSKRMANVEAKSYLLDTGWVNSPESAYVKVAGSAAVLEDNELYYWQVQSRDKDGNDSPLSAPASFRMAVGSGWQSTNGIWVGASTAEDIYYKNGWIDYTVEQEMTSSTVIGLVFRALDARNCYFWQIRPTDNRLNPHTVRNGSAAQVTSIDLGPKGITLPKDRAFKVKITVTGNWASTWIDTGTGYVLADENRDLSGIGAFAYGPIGYRTGSTESGTVDNVVVTKSDGTSLANLTFDADSKNYFAGTTIRNGALSIPTGLSTFTRMAGFYEDDSLSKLGNFSFFRSDKLSLDPSRIEKAIVSMAARGTESFLSQIVDLYVNGKSVGFGPARDYTNAKRTSGTYTKAYYNAYDVTGQLQAGDNVIGALAVCRDTTNRALLVQMDVYYKDGTKATLTNTNDGTWKTLDGTDAFGDTGRTISAGSYFSMPAEDVNVAKYPSDWYDVDFDDSGWIAPAVKSNVIQNGTSRVLTPYTAENTLRVLTDEPTKSVKKLANGNWFIDLGKEIVGSLSVNLNSPAAATVTVRMGEQLNADGSVRYNLACSPTYQETWKLKAGDNIFKTATMKNFRYIEIIGFGGTIEKDNFKGWAMQQGFDTSKASFTSSNTLLNREFEMSQYTIQATNQDLYVDSQARERRAYEGDLLVNSNTSYAMSDNYSLARHSNEYLIDNPTWPLDYKLFSVEMAWQDYLYTGNKDSLMEYYDSLLGKLSGTWGGWSEERGLVGVTNYTDQQYGGPLIDWPTGERDGYVSGLYSTIFNAEYVGIYDIMAKIADVKGDTANANLYRARSERIRANLLQYAYDPIKGAFYDSLTSTLTPNRHYSLHASAYALAYGIYDSEEMKEKVAAFVGNNGYFKGSIYATYFILRGLYNVGGGDEAAALLTNTDISTTKTFAYVLDVLKATISAEAWDNSNKSNLTLSHPWGSSPGCAIVQGMFGILPTSPGFDTFDIKIQPGNIASASLKTPSIKGTISSSFTDGNSTGIKVNVTIPANTRAKVTLPDMGEDTLGLLNVNGRDMVATRDGSFLSVELGSGQYAVRLGGGFALGDFAVSVEGTPDELIETNTYRLQSIFTENGGDPKPASEYGVLTYASGDEHIVHVDENGTLSPKSTGKTTIRVTLTMPGPEGTNLIVRKSVPVTCRIAALSDLYIAMPDRVNGGGNGRAVLIGVTETGKEVALDEAKFTSLSPAVLTVTEDGLYQANAVSADAKTEISAVYLGDRPYANDFPAEKMTGEKILLQEDFSGGVNNLFGSLAVDPAEGALLVPRGNATAIIYDDAKALAWRDYTVSGRFKIRAGVFTLVFRAQDSGRYYLWQYENGTLKTHINTTQYGEKVPFPAEAHFSYTGYNDFAIKVEGNAITAYLNGVQVGTPIVDPNSTYLKGSIGVRTGGSEDYWIDDLKVTAPTARATKETAVSKLGVSDIYLNLLDVLVKLADQVDSNRYTEETAKPFEAALTAAKEILSAPESHSDADADDAALALIKTQNDLVYGVNRDSLKAAIDRAEEMLKAANVGKYIPASVENLSKRLTPAKAINADAKATQAEVDDAFHSVIEAIAQMYERGDKAALQALFTLVSRYNQSSYTPASWKFFTDALTAAQKTLNNPNALKDEVDTAYRSLTDATIGLTRKADITGLNAIIAFAQQIVDNIDDYIPSTVVGLEELVGVAKLVAANPDATQAEANAAATALNAKVLIARLKPDMSGLLSAMTIARVYPLYEYTKASADRLTVAITAGDALLSAPLEDVEQKAVDAATERLNAAITGLVKNPVNGVVESEKATTPGKEVASGQTIVSKMKITKITVTGKKKVIIKWTEAAKSAKVSGYQLQYRVVGSPKWKTKTVSAKSTSLTIKQLKKNKKYQVRIRAYRTVSATKNYGAWSTVKVSKKVK